MNTNGTAPVFVAHGSPTGTCGPTIDTIQTPTDTRGFLVPRETMWKHWTFFGSRALGTLSDWYGMQKYLRGLIQNAQMKKLAFHLQNLLRSLLDGHLGTPKPTKAKNKSNKKCLVKKLYYPLLCMTYSYVVIVIIMFILIVIVVFNDMLIIVFL